MTFAAIITIIVILAAVVLFATDRLPMDLVAIGAMVLLVIFGVISAEQGISGFSNPATVTVAFMFVISAALLKTGALQYLALRLSGVFRTNFMLGMVLMMLMIAVLSAFINNTPVVAIFIPIVLQIAHASGQSPSKMLIPLSFASIFGGLCTLIGTSTNLLVSGIAEKQGLPAFSMFDFTLIGSIFLLVGVGYMALVGIRFLPKRESGDDIGERYGLRNYLAEIELMPQAAAVGKRIMDTVLVKEIGIDIIEVRRGDRVTYVPPGDFILESNDVLKVRSDLEKLKKLKDRERISVNTGIMVGENNLKGKDSTLVEMVITANSEFIGRTMRQMDFRHRFRAIPLGLCHRDEIIKSNLYEVKLKAGDVILAEVKTHFVSELKKLERGQQPPFVLLSEDVVVDFNQRRFFTVLAVIAAMVVAAATGALNIVVGVIAAVALLVIFKCISMREVYRAINWKIVFLMAGVLSFGTAMNNTGLDLMMADSLVTHLDQWGPIAVLSGLYLLTSLLTEVMSNTAAAALVTPIAIATAASLGLEPMPFLIAVMFAASASFITPTGYQTNTMVFSAGHYKFFDFARPGILLNILFWILATLTIPLFYPFV